MISNSNETIIIEEPIPSFLPSNDWQWLAFIWMKRCSAILSILGSSTVLYMILSDRKRKLSQSHNRLITAMSCIDILSSIAHAFATAPLPREYPFSYGASGTRGTCNAQGFFAQLSMAAPTYNAMLSIYYVLVVKYQINRKSIARKIEPFMHAVAILYPLSTAIAGLSIGLFNSNGFTCYIHQYPFNCEGRGIDCTRGNDASKYRLYFVGVELVFIFIVNVICMIILIAFIQKRERARTKYIFRGSSPSSHKSEQSKNATRQALLFIGAFVITYVWGFVSAANHAAKGSANFTVLILGGFFVPLQGFFNFIVYLRPRYNSLRKANSSKSFLWLLKNSVLKRSAEMLQNKIGDGNGRRCSMNGYELGVTSKTTMKEPAFEHSQKEGSE